MNVAYVRVSTVEQNEARQIEALEKYGIEKWFIEKVSGKNTKREKLQEMLNFIREGDTVYIHDYSRLARSMLDLFELVERFQEKGVFLVSNKESIDTSTATGKLMLTIFAGLAEFERANLLERQREGIEIAKREGKYKGRKKKEVPDFDSVYHRYIRKEITATAAARELKISRPTFYNLAKCKSKVLDFD